MKIKLKNWTFVILSVLLAGKVQASQLLDDTTMDQYADQQQGNYQPMNLDYAGFNSLGMIQSAWQDPLQNLGEGQIKPAYSKYYWSPDLVLPVRLRERMMTIINFPEWELVEDILTMGGQSGGQVIYADKQLPNSVLLAPMPGKIGLDTNIIVIGRSGNKYVFYVKTEGVNTERLTNSIIDIDVVGGAGTSGGSPSSGVGSIGGASKVNANNYYGGGHFSATSNFTKRFLKEDWIKSIPMDPTKFRFDIETYVPNPDDVVIAPERVWRDDIFTYIDLGEKALNMIQRPIVTLLVERVETPVGFRTKGPNNRLIIVEGVGDMVLRNGKRMVCLKLRRSDEEGLQYVTYAEDGDGWDIGPKIPGGKNGGANGGNGASGSGANGDAAGGANGGANGANGANGAAGGAGAAGGMCVPGMICNNLDYSKMTHLDSAKGGLNNPYAEYKYGSAFSDENGGNLSIELGTDGNVNNLEQLWGRLSGQYSSLLGGYEPFYSVDTPADGQGKELFHLRVGPIKNLESGDSICSQLGRNGVFCSVIRVQ